MANVVIGKLTCEQCGNDCTHLWGSKLEVRGSVVANTAEIQRQIAEVDKMFGKHNFYLCWPCAAKLMGARTLEEQKAMAEYKAKMEREKAEKETKLNEYQSKLKEKMEVSK